LSLGRGVVRRIRWRMFVEGSCWCLGCWVTTYESQRRNPSFFSELIYVQPRGVLLGPAPVQKNPSDVANVRTRERTIAIAAWGQ